MDSIFRPVFNRVTEFPGVRKPVQVEGVFAS